MRPSSQRWTVARLGCAQTLAWASTYYLPAMLAVPMARDLGVATSMVFAAFSLALIVSALLGPLAGRAIDRHGGRPVLVGPNLLFGARLAGMGLPLGGVLVVVLSLAAALAGAPFDGRGRWPQVLRWSGV